MTAHENLRELEINPEPCGLYRALCQERVDTALLESGDGTEGRPGQSLLLVRAALRIQIRNRTSTVFPLTPYGEALCLVMADDPRLKPFLNLRCSERTVFVHPEPDSYLEDLERLTEPGPFDTLRCALKSLISIPNQQRLLVGVFNFELIAAFEDIPGMDDDDARADFLLAQRFVRIDHRAGKTQLFNLGNGKPDFEQQVLDFAGSEVPSQSHLDRSPLTKEVEVDLSDADFSRVVRHCRQKIHEGEVFQVVPSRSFRAPCQDPLAAYRRLRQLNPSPYQFFLRSKDEVLFGASPETCVKVTTGDKGARLTLRPIAGTRPRGRDGDGNLNVDLDNRLAAELVLDTKEQAEHMMLVDLARNDVARVCVPGSRRVSHLLSLEHYSHVSHLVSEIEGRLRPDLDALHAYQACMNMGTLTGAPKLRATELIAEFEATPRGPYGGAVAYLLGDGGTSTSLDSAIAIRSAQVRDGTARVRAGAGVVRDSNPSAEALETRRKAAAVLMALRPERTPKKTQDIAGESQ